VERFHQTLKAAIMCHADQHWTKALPLVLLGIRSSVKADLQASSAELVYGESLRIPGEFLTQAAHPVEPVHLTTHLR
jgi:cleavage and polyadenylation specificity factor subunit 1